MTYLAAIAISLLALASLIFCFLPPPSNRDAAPQRLQQGGSWSDRRHAPDDDG